MPRSLSGGPRLVFRVWALDEADILRTIAAALGVNASGLAGAATRVPMVDFFQ